MVAPDEQGKGDPRKRTPLDHRAGDVRQPIRRSGRASGKREVDERERANVVRAFSWSLAGAMGGGMAGYTGLLYGAWGREVVVLLALGGWAITFTVPLVVAAIGGWGAAGLSNPSGAGTPRRREYSLAESLAARGLLDEAIRAFEVASAEDPADPTPCLKIARIQRDRLGRHEDAARWFKLALDRTEPRAGAALLATKELTELYAVKLAAPARAAPLLARLAAERPGTPEGDWAAEALKQVKPERVL